MAVLHRKEEKIQAVLGRLPKKYNSDDFVAMFIKLYSKDWGKIKSAYIKASQDKEPGTVIHMPKPELYLKQILEIFLNQRTEPSTAVTKEEAIATEPIVPKEKKVTKTAKPKSPAKKTVESKPAVETKKAQVSSTEKSSEKIKKAKVALKNEDDEKNTTIKKPKVVVKKKTE
ncbi:hypothetical protein [Pedobacter insulae]|uniref:Uncharacterized protein n=1 Tax=Pedobacter insulae TaxID=414048 RepID=A0A1I3A6A2_9SPHI|nr:hypothetical protein [Pedobacter insulae]SFH45643.1 hypothetical protein SAMN04489864_11341 [Pedobacter insulae]